MTSNKSTNIDICTSNSSRSESEREANKSDSNKRISFNNNLPNLASKNQVNNNDIISELNIQYDQLLSSSNHQKKSTANLIDLYQQLYVNFDHSNNEIKSLTTQFFNEQQIIENDYLKVISSIFTSIENLSLFNNNEEGSAYSDLISNDNENENNNNSNENNKVIKLQSNSNNYPFNNHTLKTSKLFNSAYEILCIMEKHTNKVSQGTEKFSKNALAPFNLFFDSMNNIYEECLSDYRSIITSSSLAKKNLDKLKSNYFEAAMKMEEVKRLLEAKDENFHLKFSNSIANNYKYYYQKKKSGNKTRDKPSCNNKNANDEDDGFITQDLYIKLNSQVQILAEHLKYEIHKFNCVCQSNEAKYNGILDKIKNNEESRVSFAQTQETKFAKLFTTIGTIFTELGKELEEKSMESLNQIKNKKSANSKDIDNSTSKANINYFNDSLISRFRPVIFSREEFSTIQQQAKTLITQIIKRDEMNEQLLNEGTHDSLILTIEPDKPKLNRKESKGKEDQSLSNDKKNTNTNITKPYYSDQKANNEEDMILKNPYSKDHLLKMKNRKYNNKALNESNLRSSIPSDFDFIIHPDSKTINSEEESFFFNEEERKLLCEKFLASITQDKESDYCLVRDIIRLLTYDVKSCRLIPDLIIGTERRFLYIKLSNLNNLYHLANVFNTITILITQREINSELDVIYSIIYISERVYFEMKDSLQINKIYLCSVISQNCIYLNKVFWKVLFEMKFINHLENQLQTLYSKLKKLNFLVKTSSNTNTSSNNNNPPSTGSTIDKGEAQLKERRNSNNDNENLTNINKNTSDLGVSSRGGLFDIDNKEEVTQIKSTESLRNNLIYISEKNNNSYYVTSPKLDQTAKKQGTPIKEKLANFGNKLKNFFSSSNNNKSSNSKPQANNNNLNFQQQSYNINNNNNNNNNNNINNNNNNNNNYSSSSNNQNQLLLDSNNLNFPSNNLINSNNNLDVNLKNNNTIINEIANNIRQQDKPDSSQNSNSNKQKEQLHLPKSSQVFDLNFFAGFNTNDATVYPGKSVNLTEFDVFIINQIKQNEVYFKENLVSILENPNQLQYQLIENTKIEEATKILKHFINHFSNFNFNISDAIDFVVDICMELNFPKERLSLFVTLINTSTFSIRNKNSIFKEVKSTMLKNLLKHNDLIVFTMSSARKYLNNEEFKKLLLVNKSINQKLIHGFYKESLGFNASLEKIVLEIKDKIQIQPKKSSEINDVDTLNLSSKNPTTNSTINQSNQNNNNNIKSNEQGNSDQFTVITNNDYNNNQKQIEFSNLSDIPSEYLNDDVITDKSYLTEYIRKRLIIWKHILKVNPTKKKISYRELSNRVYSISYGKESPETTDNSLTPKPSDSSLNFNDLIDNFNIIKLDVLRTYFKSNVNESRNALENILKAFVLYNNSKCYCQGMNYIVSFLYMLTQDEEEVFYIFLCLYMNTDFGLIFSEDLAKLKQFFYIFERLLILYTPELNSYFFHNNIGSSYYCSPWFMTLFTNCYQIADNSQISLVLIRIWDEFLVNGWKAMLKTGIVLLMAYEDIILNLKYEDMLNFLFNEVLKAGFFSNKNFIRFVEIWNKINFPNELINNLENEYAQDAKVMEQMEKLDKMFK